MVIACCVAEMGWSIILHEPCCLSVMEFLYKCPFNYTAVSFHASHQGELSPSPSWITPGFSHVGIVLDDAAGRRDFSGISCFPYRFIQALLHTHLNHTHGLSRPRYLEPPKSFLSFTLVKFDSSVQKGHGRVGGGVGAGLEADAWVARAHEVEQLVAVLADEGLHVMAGHVVPLDAVVVEVVEDGEARLVVTLQHTPAAINTAAPGVTAYIYLQPYYSYRQTSGHAGSRVDRPVVERQHNGPAAYAPFHKHPVFSLREGNSYKETCITAERDWEAIATTGAMITAPSVSTNKPITKKGK
ncbi:hypothetical protein PR048_023907 [Dryococelus australis]|uniref:Uncharacterized protein n=1 Tax=Dryococelus australis TaxID=614101 RepID=A0ABQ9GVG1_9NEOP|nr:hypothetical protein PR048_023907 [Dryococelus australis]